MYDIMCGAISMYLNEELKNTQVTVSYSKKKDKLSIRIKHNMFDREFITGYSFFTDIIHEGWSGEYIAKNILKQYRRWVNNNFFKSQVLT